MVHRSLPFQLLDVRIDPGGRYVILQALITSTVYVLVGLYLPPPADVKLLYNIMQIVTSYGFTNVIGHFNLVPCLALDRFHPSARWSPGL